MSEPVLHAFDAATGIGRVTFNRPEVLNALDVASARAFQAAVSQVTSQPGLRCVVLAGAGRAFCAGGDVASFSTEPARVVAELLDALHPALVALRACPAPVLAVVQGAAAGAGFSIAIGADYVLASDTARFVIAYDRVGAAPDAGGTWHLARKVGRARAFSMMLLGQTLAAEAALGVGIVSELVPEAELQSRAEAVALRIASGPTAAYGRFKRLFDNAHAASFEAQLDAERQAFIEGTATADFREGAAAFLARREPSFRGE